MKYYPCNFCIYKNLSIKGKGVFKPDMPQESVVDYA